MSKYIFECRKITKSFRIGKERKLEVLKGVDLKLENDGWMMLLGASGSGKSTLLNIIGTIERPDSGELIFDGKPYSTFNPCDFRNQQIGFVFQSYHLLPELNVLENVMLAAQIGGDYSARSRAEQLIERVGLTDRIHHRPAELSGGECQRAAIARSLMNSPRMLLADEPTGNLDAATGNGIMQIFKELHSSTETPLAIIMITHNPDLAANFGTHTVTIAGGKITNGSK